MVQQHGSVAVEAAGVPRPLPGAAPFSCWVSWTTWFNASILLTYAINQLTGAGQMSTCCLKRITRYLCLQARVHERGPKGGPVPSGHLEAAGGAGAPLPLSLVHNSAPRQFWRTMVRIGALQVMPQGMNLLCRILDLAGTHQNLKPNLVQL